jgi:hypothetical protein
MTIPTHDEDSCVSSHHHKVNYDGTEVCPDDFEKGSRGMIADA